MVRRIPSKQRNVRIVRQRDPGALFRLALLLCCGLVLAGGFVYAGGQHFAALKLGYQTENLRKIKNELAQAQNRLEVERQAAASPARLERAARELGMQPMQAAQIDPLKRALTASLVKTSSPAPEAKTQLAKASPALTATRTSPVVTVATAKSAQAKVVRPTKP